MWHFVEQVMLYRTAYVTFLLHSNFLIDFFKHLSSLSQHKNRTKTDESFFWFLQMLMQFLMRNQNIILVLWFEQVIIAHYQVFGERVFKKMQKLRKYFDSIWLISQRKQRRNPNYLLPKWSARKALQTLKVSSNLKKFTVRAGWFLVDTPIYIHKSTQFI